MRSLPAFAVLVLLTPACSDSAGPPRTPGDPLPPPVPLVAVSAGFYSTCGLGPSSETYCWGTGREGQLGAIPIEDCTEIPGEAPCASSPLRVTESFTTVAVGGQHACGLRNDGLVFCWGDGSHGQLGAEPTSTSCGPLSTGCAKTPGVVPLSDPVVQLSSGGSHNCVLDAAGVARCWGYNQGGRLGTGDQDIRPFPVAVSTDLRFTAISAGGSHTCAIAQDGRAYCWGYNHLGQLGEGTTDARAVPTPVATELRFVDVTTGTAHSCARTAEGAAYCWGGAGEGQLGTEAPLETCEFYPCSRIPVPVAGNHLFTALSAGYFTCGVATDGSFCWGTWGLGDTLQVPSSARTGGKTGDSFLRLTVGFDHACGVAGGEIAYCWGSDYEGKLGDGPAPGGPLPVIVRQAPDSGP